MQRNAEHALPWLAKQQTNQCRLLKTHRDEENVNALFKDRGEQS